MPESFTFPLSEFYLHAKLPLPGIEAIPAAVRSRSSRCSFTVRT